MSHGFTQNLAYRFTRIHRADSVLKHHLNIPTERLLLGAIEPGEWFSPPADAALRGRFQANKQALGAQGKGA